MLTLSVLLLALPQRLLGIPVARQLKHDTLLLVMSCGLTCMRQALLQQPELLGRVQDPAPAFQFMRNLRASMSGVVSKWRIVMQWNFGGTLCAILAGWLAQLHSTPLPSQKRPLSARRLQLKCLYQPNGETSALTTMTQGRQAW